MCRCITYDAQYAVHGELHAMFQPPPVTADTFLPPIRRGVTAAIATYLEERGGLKLFTLEEEELEAPPLARLRTFLDIPEYDPNATSTSMASPPKPVAVPNLSPGPDGASLTLPAINVPRPGATSPSPVPDQAEEDHAPKDILTSAKLFAVMSLADSQELLALCSHLTLDPGQSLFHAGDPSNGVYIVSSGALGVYFHRSEEGRNDAKPISTLHFGETVGDVDLVDGSVRSVSAAAMGEGCGLIHVEREVWLKFVSERPRTLQSYLQRVGDT
jgi:hypothetical protein